MERKLIDPNRAALLATAPHLSPFTAVAPLVVPTGSSRGFRIIQHWGNLSPYFTVDSHGLPETSSLITKNCELEEVHWLQRHGARSVDISWLDRD